MTAEAYKGPQTTKVATETPTGTTATTAAERTNAKATPAETTRTAIGELIRMAGVRDSYEGALRYAFVSYAHADSQAALPIIAGLQRLGVRVWYDAGIEPGTEWDATIADHITRCSCFIFLCSANSLASRYCRDEVGLALRRAGRTDAGWHTNAGERKDILVARIDDAEIPDVWELRLNDLQQLFSENIPDTGELCERIARAAIVAPCRDTCELDGATLVSYVGGSLEPEIPDGVARIARHAFRNPNARRINLPEGITKIDEYAFTSCGMLEEVILPSTLESIGDHAFMGCISLRTVRFFDDTGLYESVLGSIGKAAFEGCVSLREVELPESLGVIDDGAFEGCVSLESLDLPGSVSGVHRRAFRGCASLREVRFGD